MKTLFVINNFHMSGNGMAASARRTVKYLKEMGHEVRVLAGPNKQSAEPQPEYCLKEFKFPFVQGIIDAQGFSYASSDPKIMKWSYKVAGLRFSIEGAHPALLGSMGNLSPFVCLDAGEDIFTLHFVPSLDKLDQTPVFQTQDGPGFPEIGIWETPKGYLFRMRPLPGQPLASEVLTTKDFREAWLHTTGTDDHFALNNTLMLLFAFASAPYGALEMHASVVMNAGKGYLFLGKSGTGKSTHSKLWLRHIPGTELLNDDNPILRLMPDRTVRVFGSPWSGKTPCYKNQDVPAGAVVRIRQAPFNKIERLPLVQAYASLMASASSFRPFSTLSDHWHHTLEGMVATLPCYVLDCLPDEDAARLCNNTVSHG